MLTCDLVKRLDLLSKAIMCSLYGRLCVILVDCYKLLECFEGCHFNGMQCLFKRLTLV